MTYKKRFIILVSIIAVLALLYAVSIISNSFIVNNRSSSYVWLEPKSAQKVTRIVINEERQGTELVKRNDQWFVLNDNIEFPARKIRIDDFLSVLTTRSTWPVRSNSASNHARFGINEEDANRIVVYGEYSVLLDLLVGNEDVYRNESYFRKSGFNEVRAGDSSIRTYLTSPVTSWYNLRLIPESEGGNFDVTNVERLTVSSNAQTQVFSRRNRTWEISGINVENPSVNNIENYIRTIVNLEGDDFVNSISRDDPLLVNRVSLELGTGRIINIRLTEADETGRVYAHVSGKDYIYSIPAWVAGRIFRDASSFETQ